MFYILNSNLHSQDVTEFNFLNQLSLSLSLSLYEAVTCNSKCLPSVCAVK